ncbi:sugar diacid recognition domain-containing protein [Sporosarcina sp. SAFN-015]|uniref:sugar diacid recognition domain-containing protein n=1 Tax=Sporosarcina sp. SAFN-015 TaxID=3387274 RepID=UPI003F8046B1
MQYFEQIAQSVVEQVSSILNIPIILTDKSGIIIGSTDIKRLGSRHDVGVQVTKSGKTMFFSKERVALFNDVLPGIAIPLHFQQQTVGMLGLIGDPLLIERYVQFVQAHIEMLLMESFRSNTVAMQMETMRDFIHRLLSYNKEENSQEILNFSKTLGFPLDLSRRCILLEIPLSFNWLLCTKQERTFNKTERDLFIYLTTLFVDNEKDIVAPVNTDQWIILKHVTSNDTNGINKKLEFAYESLQVFLKSRKLKGEVVMLYSDCYSTLEGLSQSCEHLIKTLTIAKRNNWKKPIVSIDNWELLSLALVQEIKLPLGQVLEKHIEKLNIHPNGPALIESFIVYCEEQLNMSQASKKLYVHRNTLIYRLQQLQQLLNIDLQSFDQCTLLYLTLKQHDIFQKRKIAPALK